MTDPYDDLTRDCGLDPRSINGRALADALADQHREESAYCAAEGSTVATLEHLRTLAAESETDRVQREAVEEMRRLRADLDAERITLEEMLDRVAKVVGGVCDAMGWV